MGRTLGGGLRGCRARLDHRHDLVFAEPDDVPVLQHMRTALGHRAFVIVDEHTIGAGVLEDIEPVAVMNTGVMCRDEALRIRQHPVVVGRAADIAAHGVEYRGTAVSEQPAVITYDAKLQRHRRPR